MTRQLEEDGFREHFGDSSAPDKRRSDAATDDSGALALPPVITVFSAPEYCNTNHNMVRRSLACLYCLPDRQCVLRMWTFGGVFQGATLSIPWERRSGSVLEYRQHKRSVERERAFTLASEDVAVKAFLREALPFLPVDFYELVAHCRQLKQMLMLSRQSSMTQLATAAASIQSALTDASSVTSQSAAKSTFALELDSEIRSPALAAVASPIAKPRSDATLDRESRGSETDELARSAHSTTEEPSGVETEAQSSATPFAKASARSSRSSRRKQQHKSRHEPPATLGSTPAASLTALHPPGNVQVLARSGSDATLKPSPPQRSRRPFFGGWKLCPGFLRICDRFFGSATAAAAARPTDLRSSVPAEVAEDTSNDSNNNSHSDDASPRRGGSRNSLTAVPMNNQLNSSDDVGSPASSPSALPLPSLSSDAAQRRSSLLQPTEAPMQLESMFPGHKPKGSDIFSKREWQALKLYFTLLDVSGNGVLMEESFVVLLAEQDSGAFIASS